MDFKKIKLNQIKYGKINEQTDIIKYNGKKLTIILSSAVCKDGIIIKNNKYYLKLDITGDVDFIGFIRDFEENNKTHTNFSKIGSYLSSITTENIDGEIRKYIHIKIPHRYNNFELNIASERIYLPTIYDVKDGTKINCHIELSNLWNWNNMTGCSMELKHIFIQ